MTPNPESDPLLKYKWELARTWPDMRPPNDIRQQEMPFVRDFIMRNGTTPEPAQVLKTMEEEMPIDDTIVQRLEEAREGVELVLTDNEYILALEKQYFASERAQTLRDYAERFVHRPNGLAA
jgi:hypothetical protein